MSGTNGSGQTETSRRRYRNGVAMLVALAALGLIMVSPAAIALGVRGYAEHRAAERATDQTFLGTEVQDGAVSYIVHQVQCGEIEQETEFGQYCAVTVGARNDGPAEVTVPGHAQRLHGSEGARHWPADQDSKPFGTLEPGEAATATIGFELPAHSTVTHVEMHTTAYTRGQAVAVGGPPLPLLTASDRSD